jgi:hypothetical protein
LVPDVDATIVLVRLHCIGIGIECIGNRISTYSYLLPDVDTTNVSVRPMVNNIDSHIKLVFALLAIANHISTYYLVPNVDTANVSLSPMVNNVNAHIVLVSVLSVIGNRISKP